MHVQMVNREISHDGCAGKAPESQITSTHGSQLHRHNRIGLNMHVSMCAVSMQLCACAHVCILSECVCACVCLCTCVCACPLQVMAALERVRAGADVMPRRQLERVLLSELGEGWEARVAEFDWQPCAAASIGQVHAAVMHDGRKVAMKVRGPVCNVLAALDACICLPHRSGCRHEGCKVAMKVRRLCVHVVGSNLHSLCLHLVCLLASVGLLVRGVIKSMCAARGARVCMCVCVSVCVSY